MLHTFELAKRIDCSERKYLHNALSVAAHTTPHFERIHKNGYTVTTRTYKSLSNNAPEIRILKYEIPKCPKIYKFAVRINPAKIVHMNYIDTSDRETSELAILQVNNLFKKCKINCDCNDLELNRIDYCLNNKAVSADIAKKRLALIRKGDIPDGFTVYKEFSPTGHRFISPKSSLYCYNGSVTINIYDKYEQMKKEQEERGFEYAQIDDAIGMLRFEIQCNNSKINKIKSFYGFPDKSVGYYLDREISTHILKYYLQKVCCTGQYYTYDEARSIIKNSKIKPDNISMMLHLLELVNKKKNGLRRSKSILYDIGYSKEKIDNTITRFNGLDVNPVTIPERWRIGKMANPIELLFGENRGNTYRGR